MENNSCENRRTLKRRIRRIISLCILITIVLFSTIVIYIGANFFKGNTEMISDYFSSYIAQSMSTESFLTEVGIGNLKELNNLNIKFKQWVDNIKADNYTHIISFHPEINDDNLKPQLKMFLEKKDKPLPLSGKSMPSYGFMGNGSMINLNISVYDNLVYSDASFAKNSAAGFIHKVTGDSLYDNLISHMLLYFNTEKKTDIKDENGNIIISVSAKLNDSYITVIGMTFFFGILLAGILAILAGSIISKILTIPVTVPLCNLDEKIKAIVSDKSDIAMPSQIVLKKPLREIESLANSTNQVVAKMREYNELLTAQNEELEAQNEELFSSKKKIEEAQTMLIQTENMASIGQLTAAITHEINTPLGAIHSNAQILDILINTLAESGLVKESHELNDIADQMREANNISLMASNRVAQIIKSLKNFSKVDQAEFQEADINEGIRSVLVLTSNLWKNRITIHEELGGLPQVKCYPGMLNQVFMNLVVNSIQSIEGNGDIYVKSWSDSQMVYVSVRDNGCGISENNLPMIFDNGFTTKGSSLGMGLGLSISQSIIKKHNGEIKVASKIGEGTEFTIIIPERHTLQLIQ